MLLSIVAFVAIPDEASGETELSVQVLGLSGAPRHNAEIRELEGILVDACMSIGALTPSLATLRRRRDAVLADSEQVQHLQQMARQAYLDFRFPDAVAALEQARVLLRARHADLLEDPSFSAVHFELARLQLEQGEEYQARATLQDLLAVVPSAEPAPTEYPPQLLSAWQHVFTQAQSLRPLATEPEIGRLLLVGRTTRLTHVITGALEERDNRVILHLYIISCTSGIVHRQRPVALGPRDTWAPALSRILARVFAPSELYFVPGLAPTELFVLSSPPGANLVLDGQPTGERTPVSIQVQPGSHQLRLELDGFEPSDMSVVAWEFQARPIEVALTPNRDRPFWRRWWFWTIAAGVVAGVAIGTSVWAARRANALPSATISYVPGP